MSPRLLTHRYSSVEYERPPEITFKMVLEFVRKMNYTLETDALIEKESREAVDSVIYTVREGNICRVISLMDINIRSRGSTVTVIVDELDEEEEIINSSCSECNQNTKDICKHSISLLYFLCNENNSKTFTGRVTWNWKEQWKKLLMDVMELSRFPDEHDFVDYSLEAIIQDFIRRTNSFPKAREFLRYAEQRMSNSSCALHAELSVEQSNSRLWFALRRGRITASVFHEAAHCHTFNGSLVSRILCEYPAYDSPAMQRGRSLESSVIDSLGVAYRRIGLVLKPDLPEFGASPDGITEECVIEVKCPASYESIKRYMKNSTELSSKCYAQIQLQMLLTGRSKGLFCVASPEFENDGDVFTVSIDFDREYCTNMVRRARLFWEQAVFPRLVANQQL